MISLPLHPDVVKKALGKHAHFVEQLVRYVASNEGAGAIAKVATMWAQYQTANVGREGMSEEIVSKAHTHALTIMTLLFNTPRLQVSSLDLFDYSVLSDIVLVDGLIAICDLRDSIMSFVKDFEDPMDKAGYPWARTALRGLRELLEQAS